MIRVHANNANVWVIKNLGFCAAEEAVLVCAREIFTDGRQDRYSAEVVVLQNQCQFRHNLAPRRELLLSNAEMPLDVLPPGVRPVRTLFCRAAKEVSAITLSHNVRLSLTITFKKLFSDFTNRARRSGQLVFSLSRTRVKVMWGYARVSLTTSETENTCITITILNVLPQEEKSVISATSRSEKALGPWRRRFVFCFLEGLRCAHETLMIACLGFQALRSLTRHWSLPTVSIFYGARAPLIFVGLRPCSA
jgi:hypothetical protein